LDDGSELLQSVRAYPKRTGDADENSLQVVAARIGKNSPRK
jgi:hypothetical protein